VQNGAFRFGYVSKADAVVRFDAHSLLLSQPKSYALLLGGKFRCAGDPRAGRRLITIEPVLRDFLEGRFASDWIVDLTGEFEGAASITAIPNATG
jgi:hypothetical protein